MFHKEASQSLNTTLFQWFIWITIIQFRDLIYVDYTVYWLVETTNFWGIYMLAVMDATYYNRCYSLEHYVIMMWCLGVLHGWRTTTTHTGSPGDYTRAARKCAFSWNWFPWYRWPVTYDIIDSRHSVKPLGQDPWCFRLATWHMPSPSSTWEI